MFRKFGFVQEVVGEEEEANGNDGGNSETFRLVDVGKALPLEDGIVGGNSWDDSSLVGKGKKYKQKKVDPVLLRRYHKIQKIANELESDHPLTIQAALTYCIQMSQLDENIDDLTH